VLVALDKFKGSVSAGRAAEALVRGMGPGLEYDLCPMADGGEGTVEAMGRPLKASYAVCGELAVLEMSAASGLAKVLDLPLRPDLGCTYGTGLMLKHAIQQPDVKEVLMGIGGSATNDGGAGMAMALGIQFLAEEGRVLMSLPRQLSHLAQLVWPAMSLPRIRVACDVDNPLLGERGATRVYGPQKGVHDERWFEWRLEKLAWLAEEYVGQRYRDTPGAGAAGGLGWGLMTFCGASLESGFELVAEAVNLEARVKQADIVITGEGRIDEQTLQGKGPGGVAALARRHGKRIVGVAGSIVDSEEVRAAFDELISIKPESLSVEESQRRGEELLEAAGKVLAQRWGVA
jgi:glycerate 2-kinase